MIRFHAIIEKFGKKGDKTGWTYIEISQSLTEQLNPGCRKAYRVSGTLDGIAIQSLSLIPMGKGNFILALNAAIRKQINKNEGSTLDVCLTKDNRNPPLSAVFLACLEDDIQAKKNFLRMPKSHQRYFSNWIESAKTETTKTRRLVQALQALSIGMNFGEMVRTTKRKIED